MVRKSSKGADPKTGPILPVSAPSSAPAAAVAKALGTAIPELPSLFDGLSTYEPTAQERLLRARLWAERRNDPLLMPESLSAAQLGRVLGCSDMASLMRKEGFREWLFSSNDVEARITFLLESWVEQLARRMRTMADKDFNNAGKLLHEISAKMREAPPTGAGVDPQKAIARLRPLLVQLGWREPTLPEGSDGSEREREQEGEAEVDHREDASSAADGGAGGGDDESHWVD